MKRGSLLILILVLSSCTDLFTKFDSPYDVDGDYTHVTGVSLPSAAVIDVGSTTTLVPTFTPAKARYKSVTWSTDNPAVATVSDSGVVSGLTLGSATIAATSVDGSKTAASVVRVAPPATGVTVSPTTLSLAGRGVQEVLAATVVPADANPTVTWTTDTPSVAEVNSLGVVTSGSAGTATITAVTASGAKTATCAVTVTFVAVTGVSVSPATLELTAGGATASLTATVTPSNATTPGVTWTSDTPSVATVNSTTGVVTPVSDGSATITAAAADGAVTASCAVTVSSLVSLVTVAGGTFSMGSTSGDYYYYDELPAHSVTVSSFRMAKYEVTQAQYQTVMGTNPSYFTGDTSRPVENVTWYDAVEFCNTLSTLEGRTPVYTITGTSVTQDRTKNGYRLPTEAEWEFAARGGNLTNGYTYSGSNTAGDVAWYDGNSGDTSNPVGTKAANELGLYDMSGNVDEWCWDWYDSYSSGSRSDPTGGTSGPGRVGRGGSWYDFATNTRVAARSFITPDDRGSTLGFRVVVPAVW